MLLGYNRLPIHQWLQHLWDRNGSIGLLVILHNRQQGATNGQTRTIECVQQLRLAFGISKSGLHATGLKISKV